MARIIFVAVFLIPAMLGTAELLHMLKLYIAFPRKGLRSYSLIMLTDGDYYDKMRYACDRLAWYGRRYTEQLIAVDTGLNNENRKKALELARQNNTVFCSAGELSLILNEIEKEKLKEAKACGK